MTCPPNTIALFALVIDISTYDMFPMDGALGFLEHTDEDDENLLDEDGEAIV